MPESKRYNIRLGHLEEVTLQAIKAYIATFLETDIDKITDTEAINFAIRCTGTQISKDITIQGTI